MELFRKVFSAMNQERVKYMVAGGIAVNLFGIERAPADLDICGSSRRDKSIKIRFCVKKAWPKAQNSCSAY